MAPVQVLALELAAVAAWAPDVVPAWDRGGVAALAAAPIGLVAASAHPALFTLPIPNIPEARKAKYQGTVVLWIVVGPDGKVHDLHVQRSLGLGLDEKAIEAVKLWKFDPARKDGQPVAVQVNVEVNFRLY